MFGRIRTRNAKFIKKKKRDQNFNVWKDYVTNRMFGKIRTEFKRLKNRVRIPKFGMIRLEFQC